MKAVILAAGKSTRTYPLTLNKPKPLLKVRNKTILEHSLDQLNDLIEEVILVIGFKSEMIRDFIGNSYKNIKIKFVEQKDQLGTGHAVLQIENLIDDKFIVMNGDDFFHKEDIKEILNHDYAVLAKEVTNPENFGIFKIDYNNNIKDIVEKPKQFISNLANCGLYVFDKDIFPILKNIKKSERGEYEITDALKEFIKQKEVYCVKSKHWIPIGNSFNLLDLNKKLLDEKKEDIKGVVEEGAITENSVIAEGTIIIKNSKISDSVIGRNCEISGEVHNSSIGDNCRIAGKVENSIIYDNSEIKNCNISFSVIDSSDLENVEIISLNNKGAVIAQNCQINNTTIYSGVKIWPNKKIQNKELKNDIM